MESRSGLGMSAPLLWVQPRLPLVQRADAVAFLPVQEVAEAISDGAVLDVDERRPASCRPQLLQSVCGVWRQLSRFPRAEEQMQRKIVASVGGADRVRASGGNRVVWLIFRLRSSDYPSGSGGCNLDRRHVLMRRPASALVGVSAVPWGRVDRVSGDAALCAVLTGKMIDDQRRRMRGEDL